MTNRLARVMAGFLMSPVLVSCSAPVTDPLLRDPAQWPLTTLRGLVDHGELPEEAERPLAQIKVGTYDMIAWVNSEGHCGLSGADWTLDLDLTRSQGHPARQQGFSGPMEAAVSGSRESEASLFCTRSRMLIRVEGQTSEPFVSGDAVAQIVDGGLNAVVGPQEAQRESLPRAAITVAGPGIGSDL
ncbi:hypothetical protein AB0K18_45015 [Nonomuraea sp. NPDC049421]|uniref:hypothetical protein n=1 Tax=Nonomuraea sp. NPDC049421 TaxID=3155275 RepID=UPI00343F1D61